MEDFFKGKMGQFFTPREVIKFSVKMMDIKDTDTVLDPACGSGGFLLNAMDTIRKEAEENYDDKDAYRIWHDFASKRLYGIEINEQIARVCKMNMIIHDDGHTNVISTDALDDFKDIARNSLDFKPNTFDFILTNPPFGASVKETEKEKGYLEKFELGKKKKNQKTEILFIERCIEFMKPETGKMAIVLPDVILTNSSLQYVRDFLMEKCQILAVVSIPSFAFSHYGAGVKSSVVFVRKFGQNEKVKNYPIFMAMAEKIGYDATGRETKENDLDLIVNEFKKFETNPNKYKGA
ncbi:MAG: N-6 DNA methylase [Rickettsiales bacterium]|nr:N-6 DNA methylase [Rickettsiales bacterium]